MTPDALTRPVYVTRWQNFRRLLEEPGMNLTKAAERLGKTQGQVTHFGGKRPTKVIGDQVASDIENAWQLPPGSLDLNGSLGEKNSETPSSSFHAADAGTLLEAERWAMFVQRGLKESDPLRRMERTLAIYQLMRQNGGKLAPEQAAQIIENARGEIEGGVKVSNRGTQ